MSIEKFRTSMSGDVLHSWAADAQKELDRLRAELVTKTFDLTIERVRTTGYKILVSSMENELSFYKAKQAEADEAIRTLNSEREANARLTAELAECRRGAERYRTALEQIVAPFEDLNFVSGNKLLTYIHDVATAALAAKGE